VLNNKHRNNSSTNDFYKFWRGKKLIEGFENPFYEDGFGIYATESWMEMEDCPKTREVYEYKYFLENELKLIFPLVKEKAVVIATLVSLILSRNGALQVELNNITHSPERDLVAAFLWVLGVIKKNEGQNLIIQFLDNSDGRNQYECAATEIIFLITPYEDDFYYLKEETKRWEK
jgi:hypothetical protein